MKIQKYKKKIGEKNKNKNKKFLEFEIKIQDIIDLAKNQLKNSISIHNVLGNLKKNYLKKI